MEIMHGWFSAKQYNQFGYLVYKDVNGKNVQVTEVSKSREYPSHWDDVVYVGEIDYDAFVASYNSFSDSINKHFIRSIKDFTFSQTLTDFIKPIK